MGLRAGEYSQFPGKTGTLQVRRRITLRPHYQSHRPRAEWRNYTWGTGGPRNISYTDCAELPNAAIMSKFGTLVMGPAGGASRYP
jgi:hypothetical protein